MSTSQEVLITALATGLITINHETLLKQYATIVASAEMFPLTAFQHEDPAIDILHAVLNHLDKPEVEETGTKLKPNEGVVEKVLEGMADKANIENAPQTPEADSAIENLKIVRVERRESKNNKRDQWEISTIDGERIWATRNDDNKAIDAYQHIVKGDYHSDFDDMKLGDVQRWQENPIRIRAKKNGKYWNILEIMPRFDDTADKAFAFMPARKSGIITQAKAITGAIVLDTETTGLGSHDQMVQIGMLNTATGEVYEKLIQPTVSVSPKAREIHGITDEQLAEAFQFDKYADEVLTFLESAETIIGFNIEFDLKILEQTLKAHDLKLHLARLKTIRETASIVDVKAMMEKFIGDPYSGDAKFRWQSLQDSAKFLDIPVTVTHQAYADAQTTWRIVEKLQSHTADPLDVEEPVSDYFEAF